MKRQVVLTPEAQDDARRIDDWWRTNRPAATGLFTEELSAALAMLETAPEIGRPYRHRIVPTLRRVLLRAARYHVYYVVTANAVRVLAVWSALRGRQPSLPRRG
ncbi:MAG: type II toxin-antitoxin system RelE/ParE family toxin [Deltaproteobacteria bacterium]|nr:type II toxin-antitoxin system RelE/ParE family toxin [Deltaproteobacteria bacterium]